MCGSTQVDALEKAWNEAAAKLRSIGEHNRSLVQELEREADARNRAEQEVEALREEKAALARAHDSLNGQVTHETQGLHALDAKCKMLSEELANEKAQLSETAQQLRHSQERAASAGQALVKAEAAGRELEGEKQVVALRLQESESERRQLEAYCSELVAKLSQTADALRTTAQQLAAAKEYEKTLEAEVEATKARQAASTANEERMHQKLMQSEHATQELQHQQARAKHDWEVSLSLSLSLSLHFALIQIHCCSETIFVSAAAAFVRCCCICTCCCRHTVFARV